MSSMIRTLLMQEDVLGTNQIKWNDGKTQNLFGDLVTNSNFAVSDFIEIKEGITFSWGGQVDNSLAFEIGYSCLCEFNADKTRNEWWTKFNRTITAKKGSKYIRFTCPINKKDSWYLKDETNNVYLYKGNGIS